MNALGGNSKTIMVTLILLQHRPEQISLFSSQNQIRAGSKSA